ncbi:CPBP family glutamic-type intramembrane protease [Candidatus Nitrospira salsa]|nr:MAG: hypothetical protein NPIRA01_18050 [Nitrospirales bacterium]
MRIEPEQWPSLALVSVAGTIIFYLLPHSYQEYTIVQFMPQILAYLGLGMWTATNDNVSIRLGIQSTHMWVGLRWGCMVGLLLGIGNSCIILYIVPILGKDITFLAQTPHAQVPTLLMIPWTITVIAIAVEFNFRGFLLGRLISLIAHIQYLTPSYDKYPKHLNHIIAILLSALVFTFDPFMVSTFQHLHWIALWDGIIWGWMWVRLKNLYAVMAAHAIEVMVLYLWIKTALT